MGRANDEERKRVADHKVCVECSENGLGKDAVMFCDQCRDFFCEGCFNRLHSKGRRQNHRRTWVEMGTCAECQESIALFHCVQCADLYCRDCFQEWHKRGGRRNHIPIILRHLSEDTGGGALTQSVNLQKSLEKARSPWLRFEDQSEIQLFYNLLTGETRRD